MKDKFSLYPGRHSKLAYTPGQGYVRYTRVYRYRFSHSLSSPHPNRRTRNCLLCKPRRFPWAASDVITDLILVIQARTKYHHFDHSLLRILNRRTHPSSIHSHRSTVQHFKLQRFSIHLRPLLVPQTLSLKKPPVSRSSSFSGQQI